MSATLTPLKPATLPRPRLMTAEEFWDFCNLPENIDRSFELVRGEVCEMSRPSVSHGVIMINIGGELRAYCRVQGEIFVAGGDSGVILGRDPDTVRGPDVAAYKFKDGKRFIPRKWSTDPPLVAVEILSPNDRPSQVAFKVSEYLHGGVREVWLVDGEDRTVTQHLADGSPIILKDRELLTTPELPGFSCSLEIVFEGTDIETE